MNPKITIVLIEDEQNICNFIATALKTSDYKLSIAHNGHDGLSLVTSQCPDIVLLDLGLPDMDGIEIIKDIRTWSSIPIIVISARTQENEKVSILDAGADDYLTKPFGIMELISRVKALLRRTNVTETKPAMEFDGITMDEAKHLVKVDGEPCELTYKEYELLKMLMQNAGIVLQRGQILDRVWGIDYEGESRTLDMHIKTLRQKLGDKGGLVQTVRNVGYTLNYRKEK